MREKVAAGIAILSILGLLATSIQYKNEALEAQARVKTMKENAPKIVKTAAAIGFMGGCIDVLVEVGKTAPQDPVFPIYQQQCMQYGQHFAQGINLQIKDE